MNKRTLGISVAMFALAIVVGGTTPFLVRDHLNAERSSRSALRLTQLCGHVGPTCSGSSIQLENGRTANLKAVGYKDKQVSSLLLVVKEDSSEEWWWMPAADFRQLASIKTPNSPALRLN